MKALGFEIDNKYAKKRALHDDAGISRVGDVVFMTAPKEVREMVKMYRKKKFDDFYKKRPKVTKAEQADQETFGKTNEVEVHNTSSVYELDGNQLLSTFEREAKK